MYISVQAAAYRLGVDADQMLDWNLVISLRRGSSLCVPDWCADPRVARAIPLLSELFQGEALEMCLLAMRPCDDGRSGVAALRDGEWQAVRDALAAYRQRFDQILRGAETGDWLARIAAA